MADIINTVRILLIRILSHFSDNIEYQCRVYWKFRKKMIKPIDKKYDIAISYNDGYALYYLADLVRAKKKAAWNHSEYTNAYYKPRLDGAYYKKIDVLVTVSGHCKNIITGIFPFLMNKTVVIENILNKKLIADMAKENPYSSNDVFRIISVGRLTEAKGYDYGAAALGLLKKEGISFLWYIIGIGELETDVKTSVTQNELDDNVVFLFEQDNPYKYIRHADLFLQTSKWEGKSIAIEEAKILGRPIVITKFPTSGSQITDGWNGLIADFDPEDIKNKIMMLLFHTEIRERILENLKTQSGNEDENMKRFYNMLNRMLEE